MQMEKYTLLNDFPEHNLTIRHIKPNNMRLLRLYAQYGQIENDVHHIEVVDKAATDRFFEMLKKRRVILKDKLYRMIKRAANIFLI